MDRQKISLEDILDEYSENDGEKNSSDINEVRDIIKKQRKSGKINDGTLRRPNPANDYKPSDIGKPDISFMNSIGIDRLRSPRNKSDIAYDGAYVTEKNEDENYMPKIRRMSDSTRAKEIEKIRKKKKRKKNKSDFTYRRETPVGEYMYTPLENKEKKRKKPQENLNPAEPDNNSDIVPSPQAIKKKKKISLVPRADITSINLSEKFVFDAESIDVYIEPTEEELKKKSDDFSNYSDADDVEHNIRELQSSIFTRFIILLILSIAGIFSALANQLDFEFFKEPIYFTAFNIFIGMAGLISSAPVIANGLKNFLTFKSDSDSVTAVTTIVCLISTIIAFFTPELLESRMVNIYMPVAILTLLFNSIGKFLIMKRAGRNFKVISKQSERYGITGVSDDMVAETLTRGTLGDFPILASMRKTDFLTDFLKYTCSSDIADKFCSRSLPASFIISFLISACMTFIRQGELNINSLSFGFSLFSMLLCASSCIGITLVSNIPINNASKTVIKDKGIILGYQSVDDFYDTNSILIEAKQLFPEGSVTLSGMKIFSDTKIDEALLDAASLTHYAGSIMKDLFNDVIAGKEEILYEVENFSYEDSMGLCGWIKNKRVLFGNRELMINHNIEGMPTRTKENELADEDKEALYLSVSGNLLAMFVVDIKANPNVKRWIKQLDRNNVHLIIKSVDSCITLKRLSKLFEIPEELMRILPKKLHSEFDNQTQKAVRLSASMACSGKFSEFARLIIASKIIHSSSVMGLIFQAVSIILGIALGSMLIVSRAFGYSYMSAVTLIIYNLVCAVITAIVVNIKKV